MKRLIPVLVILAMLFAMPGLAFATVLDEPTDAAESFRLSLTGHAEGFGDADVWISGTAVDLIVDKGWEDSLRFGLNAVVGGYGPVRAVAEFDEEGLKIAFPELDVKNYHISYETLMNVFGDKADDLGINVTVNAENPAEILAHVDTDALAESLSGYADIFTGFANDENTVKTSGDYELAGLGETVSADTVVFTPTRDDWSKVISSFLTKLQSDEAMMNLIETGIAASSQNGEDAATPEETMKFIRDMISTGIEDAEMYASFLAGTSFTLVTTDEGVAAVKVEKSGMFSFGYEGFGSLDDTRRDAIVSYSDSGVEILALNTVAVDDNGINGKLTIEQLDAELRYAFGDGNPYFSLYAGVGEEVGAQLTVADADDEGSVLVEAIYNTFDADTQEEQLAVIDLMLAPDDTVVEMPEDGWVELQTEEEIREAAEGIYEAVCASIGVETEAA